MRCSHDGASAKASSNNVTAIAPCVPSSGMRARAPPNSGRDLPTSRLRRIVGYHEMKTNPRQQPKQTRLPEQRWEQARDAYVRGEGSLRVLAKRFTVSLATTEARSRREGWVKLRRQREQGALKQLVGDIPVSVPRGPIAAAPVEDVGWWAARDKEHLLQNL